MIGCSITGAVSHMNGYSYLSGWNVLTKSFYLARPKNIRAKSGMHNAVNGHGSRAFRSVESDVPTSAAVTIGTLDSHIGSVRYFESGRRVAFFEYAFLLQCISELDTR